MSNKFKDSYVEWIGEIPKHWEVTKIKNEFIERNEKVSDNEYEALSVTKKGVFKQLENVAKTDNHDNRKKVCKGDFVINSRSDRKQSCGLSEFDGSVSVINIVLESKRLDRNFVKYVLKNHGFAEEFYKWGTGIVGDLWSTKYERMKGIMIPIPPNREQKQIAKFLDEKVLKIDEIIKIASNSITEYNKLKYSLITKCVTKGIEKDKFIKNTNSDWIGNVKEEWEFKKLKYIFSIKKEIAGEVGYDILSVTQEGIKIKDISKNEGQIASDYSKYQIVEKGDFVMNHMDLLTGGVDCSKYYGVTSPDYRVFKFKNPELYSPEYYTYIMQICYKNKIFYGLGQGVSNLGRWRLQTDKFLNFILPVPSKEEQERIVSYLDEKCIEIDNLIEQKQKLLVEMEAYKKSLIYECVTGKREVK